MSHTPQRTASISLSQKSHIPLSSQRDKDAKDARLGWARGESREKLWHRRSRNNKLFCKGATTARSHTERSHIRAVNKVSRRAAPAFAFTFMHRTMWAVTSRAQLLSASRHSGVKFWRNTTTTTTSARLRTLHLQCRARRSTCGCEQNYSAR